MAQQHAVGVVVQAGLHHASRVGGNLAQRAFGDPPFAHDLALGVQADHIEPFVLFPQQQGFAEMLRVSAVSDPARRLHGASLPHPGQRNNHGNQRGRVLTDPAHRHQLLSPGFQHVFQIVESIQQLMGNGICIASGIGVEQQQLQDLMILEVLKSLFPYEAFPKLFPVAFMRILFFILFPFLAPFLFVRFVFCVLAHPGVNARRIRLPQTEILLRLRVVLRAQVSPVECLQFLLCHAAPPPP